MGTKRQFSVIKKETIVKTSRMSCKSSLFMWRVASGYIERNTSPPGDALSPVICGQLLLTCVKHTRSTFLKLIVLRILKL